jgi:CBS domain-containing protein
MSASLRTVLERKGRGVETVDPDATVLLAVTRMNERHIGSLVVTRDGLLLGIVTERDMLTRVLADKRDPEETRVHEVMTRDPVIVDPDITVDEALVIVSKRRCRHLPVMHNGTLFGLISAGDLTAWIVRDQRRTIEDLYDYVTR